MNNYIKIYKEILEDKRKRFPKEFWKDNKREKAEIIFKHLFEEVLKWDIEKLITDFNYKIVSQYKLTSPFTEIYNKSVGNVLRDVYSEKIKGQRLPVTKQTREKISIAQKNLPKEKRENITKGRRRINNDKEYIKKLSDTKLGESNPSHKLKIEQVRKIKKLWKTGLYTTICLGEKFEISRQSIADIVYGRTWKQV